MFIILLKLENYVTPLVLTYSAASRSWFSIFQAEKKTQKKNWKKFSLVFGYFKREVG